MWPATLSGARLSHYRRSIPPPQDFVGASNVPLLEPLGQFGTRALGGNDAASARYIFTRLSPITPVLFPQARGPSPRGSPRPF